MKLHHVPPAAAALSVLAALGPAPALAASVSYTLDQSNVNAAPHTDGTNFVQASIADNPNGNIDFTVQTLPALSGNAGANYGIDSFGFNTLLSLTAANFLNLPVGWGVQSTKNMGGFGNFVQVANGTGSTRVDPLTFSIGGNSGDTPTDYVMPSTGNAGEGNTDFAAHVAGLNTQPTSVFVGGSTPVPEADVWSMMLVGLGLLGLRLRRYVGRSARSIHA